MGKNKRAAAASSPSSAKKPAVESAGSTNHLRPLWQIAQLDVEGPFGWRNVSADTLWTLIHPRMVAFEKMTWQEILHPQSGSHAVDAGGIIKPARDRLVELRLDDVDTLMSLRLQGKERLWGTRVGAVFSALWWDPEHAIWPSQKKHT